MQMDHLSDKSKALQLIAVKEQRLHRLRMQEALQGTTVDPSVTIEIEQLEQKLTELQSKAAEVVSTLGPQNFQMTTPGSPTGTGPPAVAQASLSSLSTAGLVPAQQIQEAEPLASQNSASVLEPSQSPSKTNGQMPSHAEPIGSQKLQASEARSTRFNQQWMRLWYYINKYILCVLMVSMWLIIIHGGIIRNLTHDPRTAAALRPVEVGAYQATGGSKTEKSSISENIDPNKTDMSTKQDQLQVSALAVSHYARQGVNTTLYRGVLGRESFRPHRFDQVTLEAKLSRPAFAYILAFRPDGEVELCYPDKADQLPSKSATPRYPSTPAERGVRYGLSEGTGLWVFAVFASDDPLPAYRDWVKNRKLSWAPESGQAGVVWWDDTQWIEAWTSAGLTRSPRGKGVPVGGGMGTVQRVTDSLGAVFPSAAAVVGITVLEEE